MHTYYSYLNTYQIFMYIYVYLNTYVHMYSHLSVYKDISVHTAHFIFLFLDGMLEVPPRNADNRMTFLIHFFGG